MGHHSQCLVWLLVLIFTPCVAAQTPTTAGDPPTQDFSHDPDLQRLTEETRRLQDSAEETIQQAKSYEERADRAVNRVIGLAQWTLGWVALVAGLVSLFAGGIGLWLSRQHRDARRAYRDNERLRRELNEAWGRLITDFDGLPEEELDTVAGVEEDPDILSEEMLAIACESAFLADHDTLLFIADRLRIIDRTPKSAGYFLRMGRFWRSRRDYCRSLLRIDRALELDPGSSEALLQKAMTLSATVSDPRQLEGARSGSLPQLTGRQTIELHRALELLRQSDRQRGEPSALTVQQRGFIYDELGDFNAAIKSYEQAMSLLTPGEPTRLGELITYNLACSLCMAERFDDALTTLESLIGKGPHMEAAAKDPQIAPLREGDLRVRFDDMLRRDRALREG